MNFNDHTKLSGLHAFLSPSNYHWINYDEEKLDQAFYKAMTAARGTKLHALANDLITLGVKLPEVSKTLNMYVNDAIGFRMNSEQTLFYSSNCYGQADTISFRYEPSIQADVLRVHDLKNGVNEASEEQLEVYAALFCLEYNRKPFEIKIELRIYQNDMIKIYEGDPVRITYIMQKIISFDKRINALRLEGIQ